MFSPEIDVLVVGAGPAGATAARELALAGLRVRMLDRAAFPRNKPCGGGISMRVVPRFPYLRDSLHGIVTHYLSRLYLEGPGGQSAVVTSDGPAALMIRRVEFDALLVSLAQNAGAELTTRVDIVQAHQDDDRVRLTARDGRGFDAPVVVAADGVHSIVARRLGINAGMARRCRGAGHDGRNAACAAARCGSVDALGGVRLRATRNQVFLCGRSELCVPAQPRRLRVYLSETRPRQHRYRLRALALSGAGPRLAV